MKLMRVTDLNVLPGFESINRYQDRERDRPAAKILPGEYYVTVQNELIATTLGSCVSVCIRDPLLRIAGMNHFLLPDGDDTLAGSTNRFGVNAMESLINTMMRCGSRRERLEIKIAGGARMMGGLDIGQRNVEFIRRFLLDEGFAILAEHVLGGYARKVLFDPTDGRMLIKQLKSQHNNTVLEREHSYRRRIGDSAQSTGDVELF